MVVVGIYTLNGVIHAVDFLNFTTKNLKNYTPFREVFFDEGDVLFKGFVPRPNKLKAWNIITVPNTEDFILSPERIGRLTSQQLNTAYQKRTISVLSNTHAWENFHHHDSSLGRLTRVYHKLLISPPQRSTLAQNCPDSILNPEHRPAAWKSVHFSTQQALLASLKGARQLADVQGDVYHVPIAPEDPYLKWATRNNISVPPFLVVPPLPMQMR